MCFVIVVMSLPMFLKEYALPSRDLQHYAHGQDGRHRQAGESPSTVPVYEHTFSSFVWVDIYNVNEILMT